MKKKIYSLLLSLILTSSFMPAMPQATAEGEEYKGFGYEHIVESEALELIDFEYGDSDSISALTVNRGVPGEDGGMGEDGSRALELYDAIQAQVTFDFEKPLNSGRYLLSFDIKKTVSTEKRVFMQLNYDAGEDAKNESVADAEGGTDSQTANESLNDRVFAIYQGKIGFMEAWIIENGLSYTPDQWCHVKIFFDFEENVSHFVIDNQYIGTRARLLGEITNFSIFSPDDLGGALALDDIALYKYTPTLRGELEELGTVIPEEFKSDIDCSITCPYTGQGNLFFNDEELTFSGLLQNYGEEEIEFKSQFFVKNFRGDVVWTSEEQLHSLASGETKTVDIKPIADLFDTYELYYTLTPTDEAKASRTDFVKFSRSKTPASGKQSKIIGCASHFPLKGSWDEFERGFIGAGLGWMRQEFAWSGGQNTIDKQQLQRIVDKGVKIVGITLPSDGTDYSDSKIEQIAESYESYAAEFAGLVDVWELGNERNANTVTPDGTQLPERYAEVNKAIYKALKRGNPNCTVLSQGIARVDNDWMERYLLSEDEPVCDGLAVHPYAGMNTPETDCWPTYMKTMREKLEEIGHGDKSIWITEFGTSYVNDRTTQQQMGVCHIRVFAHSWAGLADYCMFHEYSSYGSSYTDNEHFFGIVDGGQNQFIGAAKQSYLAVSNFNAMTDEAEFVDYKNIDNEYYFRFKKPDGRYVVMMYANRDVKNVSWDFGAISGTLYDIKGNATDLTSADGKYTFNISDEPCYFEYFGESYERIDSSAVSTDKSFAEITKGETVKFELTIPDNAKILATGKNNTTVKVTQNGTKAIVEVTANTVPESYMDKKYGIMAKCDYNERYQEYGTMLYRDYIDVVVEKGGKTVAKLPLAINYVHEQADVEWDIEKDYKSGNWKGVITVKNNNPEKVISGRIDLTSPVKLAQKVGFINVADIKPGAVAKFEFQMPGISGSNKYEGVMTLADGEKIFFAAGDSPRSWHYNTPGNLNLQEIHKAKEETVIDGIIKPEEWEEYQITSFDKSQVTFGSQGTIIDGVVEKSTFDESDDYGGAADFSGDIYSKWDDEYLYVAAMVNDDVHWNHQIRTKVFLQDCLSITAKPTTTQRHDTRIDFGYSDWYNHELYNETDKNCIFINWSGIRDAWYTKEVDNVTDGEGSQLKVVRENGVTTYELKIPKSFIANYEETWSKNQPAVSMSYIVRDYDGDRDKTNTYTRWFVFTQ